MRHKASKTPYISVIIPAYNAAQTLPALLSSLKASTYKHFEVIVGDDASEQEVPQKNTYPFAYTVVRLKRNSGPAVARNTAAKKARGKVLVFLDSDVEVYRDTLVRIAEKFIDDPDLTALTGVWDKEQKTTRFFPQFKALRDWSYWTNERARDGYYYLFSTRIAAIRRTVFDRLGGFDAVFRQMEDVEITYRIAKRYAIIFASDVRVHHEFEGFWTVAKKYFWRSFYWTRLWGARKKFDPVATTMWETLAAFSGVGTIFTIAGGAVVFFVFPHPWVKASVMWIALGLFTLHCLLLRKFLHFVYTEKGLSFMLKSVLMGLVLYCFILSGAVYYQLRRSRVGSF